MATSDTTTMTPTVATTTTTTPAAAAPAPAATSLVTTPAAPEPDRDLSTVPEPVVAEQKSALREYKVLAGKHRYQKDDGSWEVVPTGGSVWLKPEQATRLQDRLQVRPA